MIPFDPWPGGAAVFLIALEVWLTRGLHMDGLADWADSVGGGNDRERRLAIMKDVRMGAFGVLALVVAVLVKWIALERILRAGAGIWIPVAFTLSRGMLVGLMSSLPYARSHEGMARPFTEGASYRHQVASFLLCLGVCSVYGPLGLGALGIAWGATRLFGARCRVVFEGVTGDLLGTANEMVTLSLLVLAALPGKEILWYTGWAWIIK
jgi:adenosylcobinamide-GDP ribazoletransferase